MLSWPNLSGLEMLSRIPSSSLFLPTGHFECGNGVQRGIEEGLHTIKKDFMQVQTKRLMEIQCYIVLSVLMFQPRMVVKVQRRARI